MAKLWHARHATYDIEQEKKAMNNNFEKTFIQSMQIACLSSIKEEGLLSDRQYNDLITRLGEKFVENDEKKETKAKAKATAETEAGPSIKYYVDGKDIPIWEKQLLTIDEAAKYFSMGTPKIRALTSDEDCEFVIWNGTRRLIKRERFAEFLNSQFSV